MRKGNVNEKRNENENEIRKGNVNEIYIDDEIYDNKKDNKKDKLGSGLNLDVFSKSKYPGEHHLPGHNYTGPGTRTDIRLDENNIPKPGEEPINRVDAAALNHDIAYESENIEDRHIADVKLIHEVNRIPNPTIKEKLERALVKNIMKAKITFGSGQSPIAFGAGIENESSSAQLATELHK